MSDRDKVNAIGKMDIGSGIHTEKARDLQGDFATPSSQLRSAEEILRNLKAAGLRFDLDLEPESEEDVAAPLEGGSDERQLPAQTP
jgi:hypothetical protein